MLCNYTNANQKEQGGTDQFIMKTVRLFTTLVMVVLCVGFASCSKSDDEPSSNNAAIVGTWAEDSSVEQYVYTFNSDGTGKWEVYNGTTLEKSTSLTYKVSGSTLTITGGGETSAMTIKELTETKLTLTSTYVENGKTQTETFVLYKQSKK